MERAGPPRHAAEAEPEAKRPRVEAPMGCRSFGLQELAALRRRAGAAPRGRFGILLHKEFHDRSAGDPAAAAAAAAADVQRFLNVFAKGSHVMPHMHPEAGKWEVFVHVDGGFNVIAFDADQPVEDASNALETVRLGREIPLIAMKESTWHSAAALDASGGSFLEFKPGPYAGVERDKVFSHQLAKPWGVDETKPDSAAELARYTGRLEAAVGRRASSPSRGGYASLRPYPREELLELLSSGPPRSLVVSGGPGAIQPIATLLAVRPGQPLRLEQAASGASEWGVFVWLAGDAGVVLDGVGQALGPDAPLLEVWGDGYRDALRSEGLRALPVGDDAGRGAVVLELRASTG